MDLNSLARKLLMCGPQHLGLKSPGKISCRCYQFPFVRAHCQIYQLPAAAWLV